MIYEDILNEEIMIDYVYSIIYLNDLEKLFTKKDICKIDKIIEYQRLGNYTIKVISKILNRNILDNEDKFINILGQKDIFIKDECINLIKDIYIQLNLVSALEKYGNRQHEAIIDMLSRLKDLNFFSSISILEYKLKKELKERNGIEFKKDLNKYVSENMLENKFNKIKFNSLFKEIDTYDDFIKIFEKFIIANPTGDHFKEVLVQIRDKHFFDMAEKFLKEKRQNRIKHQKPSKKSEIISKINSSKKIDDALSFKNEIMQDEIIFDATIYSKLILLEDNFENAKKIFNEYIENVNNPRSKDRIVYKALLMKAPTPNEAELIIDEMISLKFEITIDIYDLLLKKLINSKDIIDYYNKLKFNCIQLDSIFLKRLADKLIGTEDYNKIQYERYCFIKISELADKIQNKHDLENVIMKLCDLDIEESTDLYSRFIYQLNDTELVAALLNILIDRDIKIDQKIYIAVLRNIIKNENGANFIYLLSEIGLLLNNEQKENLTLVLKNNQILIGGITQFLLKKDLMIKKYGIELKLEKDPIKQQYIMGKIHSLTSIKSDECRFSKSVLNKRIEIMKNELDTELYSFELQNLIGQLGALYSLEKIYNDIIELNIPIKYVIFIENEEFRLNIELLYYQKYLVKADNINVENINSFVISSSPKEYINILKNIDYINNDVRVIIYGLEKDSIKFEEGSIEHKEIYSYINTYLKEKICYMNYSNYKKLDNKTTNNIVINNHSSF